MDLMVRGNRVCMAITLGILVTFAGCVWSQQDTAMKVVPSKMPKLGTVDARYLSYNVEMVEVTGGRFWKPYKDAVKTDAPAQPDQEAGVSPSLYQYRSPIDLNNARLRKLAAALDLLHSRQRNLAELNILSERR